MAASDEKESRLVRFLEVFGNIFALNVIYVICCIPVVTIGAATAALYTVALKMVKKEDGPIVKSFWKALKDNFKKGTLAWLIVLGAMTVMWAEYVLVFTVAGGLSVFYMVVLVIEVLVAAFVLPFLFPLIARYENSLWNTFKNSLLLSISNFGSWLKIALAWFAPICLTLLYPKLFLITWYFWLFLIFGLIAYGTSYTLHKVFERVERQNKS